jgi:hypothetical protein
MPDGSARGTMAGTVLAVAYSMEVQLDRCTVRTTTKESRRSFETANNFGKEEASHGAG